jgi:hypothetical protein
METDISSQRWSWATLAAAAFTPTVVFISVPNNVILRNLGDLPYCPRVVGMFLAGFVASWIVGFAIMTFSPRSRFCRRLTRVGLVVGVCVILFDVVAFTTPGTVRSLPLAVLIDATVIVAVAIVVGLPRLSALVQFFRVVALVLLVYGVGTHVRALIAYRQRLEDRSEHARARIAEEAGHAAAPFDGNIYHIILDGFQSEAYEVLAARDSTWRFDGFTYYPRFRANYFVTEYSLPELFNGTLYSPEQTLSDWLEGAKSGGLLKALSSHGFELALYPHRRRDCSPLGRSCNDSEAAWWVEGRLSAELTVIDLWFVGLLPRSLGSILVHGFKTELPNAAPGAGLIRDVSSRDVFSLTRALMSSNPAGEEVFTHKFMIASVANFRKAIAEESTRPSIGQYVFVHPMVPHPPSVLDANCKYKGPDADPHSAKVYSGGVIASSDLDQAQCALSLVQELIERLKELKRYDHSLIVVQSDHGMDWDDAPVFLSLYPETGHVEWGEADDNLEGHSQSSTIGRRSHALLLVKFPGSHEFSVSNDEVEMLDLAPTILETVGLQPTGYPGIALQSPVRDLARTPVFFGGLPEGRIGTDPVPIVPNGGLFRRFQLEGKRPGRYVRVQLTGTDALSLAEVEVVGTVVPNLALNRAATQSSTYLGHDAGLAVDGNTDDEVAGSVTQTGLDSQAWWEVDLGTVADIKEVQVWNRTDSSSSHLSNFYVLISSQPIPVHLKVALKDPAVFHAFVVGPAGRPSTVRPAQWKYRGDVPFR